MDNAAATIVTHCLRLNFVVYVTFKIIMRLMQSTTLTAQAEMKSEIIAVIFGGFTCSKADHVAERRSNRHELCIIRSWKPELTLKHPRVVCRSESLSSAAGGGMYDLLLWFNQFSSIIPEHHTTGLWTANPSPKRPKTK